ncbi:MAG: 5'/3'-nucleotidase SurE [Planctomycetota bacterium]
MRILLTNDDGIDAPGIKALHDAITPLGEVHVVAPALVQSATSHAVTFHRPITVEKRGLGYAVSGRPADCVRLGLNTLIEEPVDLVVSGMNCGANVGVNVLYSGTVGAAREATLNGVPGVAVSLHINDWQHDHWERAALHAAETIEKLLEGPMDGQTLININVPVLDGGAEPVGVKVAPVSLTRMVVDYEPGTDDAGNATYRIASTMTFSEREAGTDVGSLYDKYITVTPLETSRSFAGDTPAWAELFGS